PCSENSSCCPSELKAPATDQSSSERSRSWPGPTSSRTCLAASRLISTRPSRVTSCKINLPGERNTTRCRCFKVAAYKAVLSPESLPVNQTSFPDGDHESP